jgi:hypothetical protein
MNARPIVSPKVANLSRLRTAQQGFDYHFGISQLSEAVG